MATLRPSPNALLNPCADPIFKSLFTQEMPESKLALASFLSALLKQSITNVILQPNELAVESIFDRQTQFDLTCFADSEPINVEMQGINSHSLYQNRAEYHVAHLLNHYVSKGKQSDDVPRVFQISVVNFNLDDDEKSYYNHYVMKTERNIIHNPRMNIIFLELPKIKKLPDDLENLTEIELWGKFFLYSSDSEKQDFLIEMGKINQGIRSAMDVLQFLSKDELEWQRETSYFNYVLDLNMAKKEASKIGYNEGHSKGFEKGLSDGLEQGLEKGLKQGIEQGLEQGLQRGRIETQIETAKKMLELNMDYETIYKVTGVSKEQLK